MRETTGNVILLRDEEGMGKLLRRKILLKRLAIRIGTLPDGTAKMIR